jgi:hypothetical protein
MYETDIPPVEKYWNIIVHHNGHAAYLRGPQALVTIGSSLDLFAVPDKKMNAYEMALLRMMDAESSDIRKIVRICS